MSELLSIENVKGRVMEIDAEARAIDEDIAQKRIRQKDLAKEREWLMQYLGVRGAADEVHDHFPLRVLESGDLTVKDAILWALRDAGKTLSSEEILAQVRLMGAGSERTNVENIEWYIWKMNDTAKDKDEVPPITKMGPHLYAITIHPRIHPR